MCHAKVRTFVIAGILLSLLPVCSAQTVKDLADQSLEELLNIKVTSAAHKPQPLRTTAAAAFVITSEDICRSGIRLLPDLLRLLPDPFSPEFDQAARAMSVSGPGMWRFGGFAKWGTRGFVTSCSCLAMRRM